MNQFIYQTEDNAENGQILKNGKPLNSKAIYMLIRTATLKSNVTASAVIESGDIDLIKSTCRNMINIKMDGVVNVSLPSPHYLDGTILDTNDDGEYVIIDLSQLTTKNRDQAEAANYMLLNPLSVLTHSLTRAIIHNNARRPAEIIQNMKEMFLHAYTDNKAVLKNEGLQPDETDSSLDNNKLESKQAVNPYAMTGGVDIK